MNMPTCFVFVPVFAWMSQRDFAWQAELFFLCSPPGVASLKGGYSCFPFQAVFHYLFYFWHEGSNTKRFATWMSTFISNRKPNTVFVFSDVS